MFLDVEVYTHNEAVIGFEDISVMVTHVMQENQNVINELKYLYEMSKNTMVYEVGNDTSATITCETAGCNDISSISTWLRGRNAINAWIVATTSPSLINLFKHYFGFKPKLSVVVIFPDGSTEEFKFKAAVATVVAFERVPDTATNPDGTPMSNNTDEFLTGISFGGGTGTFPVLVGGSATIVSSPPCEWWKFVTTIDGVVVSVTYECL